MLSHYHNIKHFLLLFWGAFFLHAAMSIPFANEHLGKEVSDAFILLSLPLLVLSIKSLPSLTRHEKIFFLLLALISLMALPSYYLSEDERKANGELEKIGRFLIGGGVSIYLLKFNNFRQKNLVLMLSIALVCSSYVMIHETMTGGYRGYSTHGDPIVFAALNACAFLIAAFLIPTASWPIRIILLLLLGVSLYATVFTFSRSAWLGIFMGSLCLAPFMYRYYFKQHKALWLAVLILIGGLCAFNADIFIQRLTSVVEETASFQEDPTPEEVQPMTLRFEMWRAGWHMFLDNPWTGVGIGDVKLYTEQYDITGNIVKTLGKNIHFHNDWIHILATRGIIGFIPVFIIFLWLFYYFSQQTKHPRLEIKTWAYMGLSFNLAHLGLGLGNPQLGDPGGIILFILMNAVIISKIERDAPKPL